MDNMDKNKKQYSEKEINDALSILCGAFNELELHGLRMRMIDVSSDYFAYLEAMRAIKEVKNEF